LDENLQQDEVVDDTATISDEQILSMFAKGLTANIPTVDFLYKKIRIRWARSYSRCIQHVLDNPSNLTYWLQLFFFSKLTLFLPYESSQSTSLVSIIARRLHSWESGGWRELWDECMASERPTQSAPSTDESRQKIRNRVRCLKLARLGRYSDSVKALSSLGVASRNDTVINELKKLHPSGPLPNVEVDFPNVTPVTVTPDVVAQSLFSFKTGTAAGGSGLKVEHLKSVVNCLRTDEKDLFMDRLTELINLLLHNKAPSSLGVYISAAPVIPLLKQENGIRPIAVGEVLRRLASKAALAMLRPKIKEFFLPHQVGIGLSSGGEALVHATQFLLETDGDDAGLSLLGIDFSNAFNSASRRVIFEECRKHFPELLRWLQFCYGDQPMLWFDRFEFRSESGVQQGDPLGPFLFCLALNVLVSLIKEHCPNLKLNCWYLDDGILIGTHADLKMAVEIIEAFGPDLGLILSEGKSQLWWPTPNEAEWLLYPTSISRTRGSGIKLLGSPVGDQVFAQSLLDKRIDKISVLLQKLNALNDPQVQFALVRSCVGFPKIAFSLRTCPPEFVKNQLRKFDNMMYTCLTQIIGTDLPKKAWLQSSLPVSMGGAGIPFATSRALPSYVASVIQTMELQCIILKRPSIKTPLAFENAFTQLCDTLETDLVLKDLEKIKSLQSHLSALADQKRQQSLMAICSEVERARLMSCSLPGSGDWLNVVPVEALDLKMTPQEFSTALKYRLGVPVSHEGEMCHVCKKVRLDKNGHHSVNCNTSGDIIARHNAVRDVIASFCRSALLQPKVEQLLGYGNERPDDIYIPSWSGSAPAAVDVSFINPVNSTVRSKAASSAGAATVEREKQKLKKYARFSEENHVTIIPFAIETFGGIGPMAQAFLHRVATFSARTHGIEDKMERKMMLQKLSFVTQRMVARMIIDRNIGR
jgi:hypothetical protein